MEDLLKAEKYLQLLKEKYAKEKTLQNKKQNI